MPAESTWNEPVLGPEQTYTTITTRLSDLALARRTPVWWYVGMGVSLLLLIWFVVAAAATLIAGIGIWGVNIPVAWGYALANYVWWIGIASGGTFISSLFYLVGAEWRNGVNRFAESLTLFAAAAAGFMPIFHLGRQGLFYWLFPYPSVMGIWPQFRSPLLWDFFALLAYIMTSVAFWYIGLIPDLATLRDRATTRGSQIFYGILALGWRGAARHWRNYKIVYLVMAGMMAPMVVSVHSIVGLDFAAGIPAGWHSTQWPPYFFIGALYSGWAATLVLIIPVRRLYGLERIITGRHLDIIAKLMLATGLLLGYCYLLEAFQPFYMGDAPEKSAFLFGVNGRYAWVFWARTVINILFVQVLWFPRLRRNEVLLVALSAAVILGMWFERYAFIVINLSRDYITSEWFFFRPTIWDFGILFGSIGLVLCGFFVFIRYLPVVSMFELREIVHGRGGEERTDG